MTQPRVKNRRTGQLSAFLLLLMSYSLLVMLYGLLGSPAPGIANAPAAWAVEAIAALGFLCNLAALAGRSGQETCNLLLETLERYQADSSQSDDITLVAIHSEKRG